ncbi:MAG: tRNA (adenosine(37)-N6)-dimethylallyltransferase MiaA [Eubacteriales bacterium]|nr:tRNA (adenosine(37)-N6)-dimethylallyltransferase MiaA [Eubacteriales bacterium]
MIVVAGPTASGKTALGIKLAKEYNGEIVSADSMQIYRGMDIGTAKATAAELAEVPHHMIDVADPRQAWSVSHYVEEAARVCDGLIERGKIPVIVGGTGLYIDSLLSGRDFAETQEDKELRQKLSEEYDALGAETMWERLSKIDPERAAKLAPTDKRRILRAIEIFELTGETITAHDEKTKRIPPRYDAKYIVLSFKDRADLYERIEKRVDLMLEQGLVDEVKRLLESGLSAESTAMQAIGYKEIAAALAGDMSMDEAVDLIKQSSRRYAKRQITWFARREDALRIIWDKTPDMEYARQVSRDFLMTSALI